MASEKRSPLKVRPLRLPGQSLDENIWEALLDDILAPMTLVILLLVLAGIEWVRYFKPLPPVPWFYTAIAVVALAYASFRILRVLPRIRILKQGRDGERFIGQYLEDLRASGYRVFHDLIGAGFNVDHVLIGPAGVFTIETKTFSKRIGPDVQITFDGKTIMADGWPPDRDPVVQAKAQAGWLRDVLARSTSRQFEVWPVVLFPGWFVKQSPGSTSEMWVLNEKAFVKFLANERTVLTPEAVALASEHLSLHIQAKENDLRS